MKQQFKKNQSIGGLVLSLILASGLFASVANAKELKKAVKKNTAEVASNITVVDANNDLNSNTTSVKINEVQNKDEQIKNIDDEITNARLRAQLGSKSRWSFKSSLAFNGGSIEKPMDAIRPNYKAGAQIETLAVLAGTVGINYRLTPKDSLSFGTGISVVDPLHGDITKQVQDPRESKNGAEIPRYQVSTPFIDWSRGYKLMGLQQITGVSYSHFTDSDSADMNSIGSLAFSQTLVGNFGESNFSGGLSLSVDTTFFGGEVGGQTEQLLISGRVMRDDFGIGLYPFAEYSFNDKVSFRTVFGYFNFVHYKNEYNNPQDFKQSEPYQSVGLGFSVTRDIYIYPNVQFTPRDIRADRTNVALSTNINLF